MQWYARECYDADVRAGFAEWERELEALIAERGSMWATTYLRDPEAVPSRLGSWRPPP